MSAERDETTAPSPERLLAEIPAGLLVVDRSGEVLLENRRLRELMGTAHEAATVSPFPPGAHRPGGAALRPEDWPVARSLRTGSEVIDEEIELRADDGDPRSLLVSSVPMRGPDHAVEGALMLVTDITDRRDRDDLREAFVDVLSHELRTPITSIYGGIALLRRRDLPRAARVSILDDVAAEAESLTRIVEDLLVVVRLQADLALARSEPVLLQRVIAAAIADERRRWPGHDFEARVPEDLAVVAGDDGLIRQVMRNLLSNAAKYGPHRGRVIVEASAGGGAVVVRVLDEGPGIPSEADDQVFRLFYRAPGTATGVAGTGIGLFVARALVEAMGGRIWANRRVEGGTEIAFRLPLYETA
jgi:PAS domain S-box-containing protein